MITLAKYAISEQNSKGRVHKEPPPIDRNEFQRDRDRIIHSAAFRRLEYKTQVFVNHEGDLYRTRLTHSIEVAQIARSISRNLQLNEDLTEAMALAHDLGHTPFGHAGQDALNECMQDFGGFEHNLQSLRVVDKLEERYASFSGLNLCFETREGILKHCSLENAQKLGELGKRFINKTQAPLEAQLVDICDALAYNNHDVDDGLRSGLLSVDDLCSHEQFAKNFENIQKTYPKADDRTIIHEAVRLMIHMQVNDLIKTTKTRLKNIAGVEAVRQNPKPLVGFSDTMQDSHIALKRLLREKLYKHPRIESMTERAHKIVRELFKFFMEKRDRLPPIYHEKGLDGVDAYARACADYIAGMTDRFAEKIWREKS